MALSLEETLTQESFQKVSAMLAERLSKETKGARGLEGYTTVEVQQLCKDGSTIWAEVIVSFIRDPEGVPVGLLGVSRNVSERKRAEEFYQAKIAAEASSAGQERVSLQHEPRAEDPFEPHPRLHRARAREKLSLRARVARAEGENPSGEPEPGGEWVEISVVDTGIGIHEKDREKIFEPFCQLENSMTPAPV